MAPTAAFVSFRFGGVDGVSVEAAKWEWALRRLGFDCYRVAGRLHDGARPGDIELPGLAIAATSGPQPASNAPVTASRVVDALEPADLVVVENLLSLPLNPPAARAVLTALRRLRPRILLHHHDLPWQRSGPAAPDWMPPRLPHALHVTVNALSHRQLAVRGFAGVHTLYNHFDFDEPLAERSAARARAGVRPDDLLLVQPTRALARKNIAGGLRFAAALAGCAGRRVVYWLSGPAEDAYSAEVQRLIDGADVPVIWSDASDRRQLYGGCDVVVFPSTWEGFGNPVIESVWARRPLAVGWYPVLDELLALGLRFWSVDRPGELAAFLERTSATGWLDANVDAARAHLCLQRLPGRLAALMEAAGWGPW